MPVRSCRVDEAAKTAPPCDPARMGFFHAPCSSDGMMLEINIFSPDPCIRCRRLRPFRLAIIRTRDQHGLMETAASPGEIAMRCSSSWTGLSRRHSGQQDACEHPTERISQGTRMARCSSALAGDTLS